MSSGWLPSIRNQSVHFFHTKYCASASVSIASDGAVCSRFARQSAPRNASSGAVAFSTIALSPAMSASFTVVASSAMVTIHHTPASSSFCISASAVSGVAVTVSMANVCFMNEPVVALSAVASTAPANPRSSGGVSSREIGSGRPGTSTRSTAA